MGKISACGRSLEAPFAKFTRRRVQIRAPVEEFCRKYGFQAPKLENRITPPRPRPIEAIDDEAGEDGEE